jgi:hypothetical protein
MISQVQQYDNAHDIMYDIMQDIIYDIMHDIIITKKIAIDNSVNFMGNCCQYN